MRFEASRDFASLLDEKDPLKNFRNKFYIPKTKDGKEVIYLCGNSLGLQPKTARDYIEQELKDWAELAVEGHFKAKNPWMSYHELLTEQMAEIVGAKPTEVIVMNSLTVNLHLLMISFYRPTKQRYKIMIEKMAFPSDQYAVKSQISFHGFSVEDTLIELCPRQGEYCLRNEDIVEHIRKHADNLALVLLGGVNYYTGQAFDFEKITRAGHEVGAVVGFDLAHAAGNLKLKLHDWDVDFAVWCCYKYLNAGPGAVGAAFVHQRYAQSFEIPRFAGWWGHNKNTRFLMPSQFDPIPGAEGWQLSNPPIFQMAALRASLQIFHEAGMSNLRQKSIQLTGYLEFLINQIGSEKIEIITPSLPNERGCQLSIKVKKGNKRIFEKLPSYGVVADWREPDVIRIAPVPLYNTFSEMFEFYEIFRKILSEEDD